MNFCSKPGCGHRSTVVLAYDYAQRRILLEDPGAGEMSPHVYAMCERCAERLTPPRGWAIEDCRSDAGLVLDVSPLVRSSSIATREREPAGAGRTVGHIS